MALDFQPLSIVSDAGFIRLINTLEPRYNLPSQRYFMENEIRERLDILKHKLQQDEPTRWNSTLFILES